jgi:SAM-dependent methyltransferase
MRISNWRYKAAAQRVFSAIPRGHEVNFAFQRLTGGLPISDRSLASSIDLGCHHLAVIRAHGAIAPEKATFYEFGAGWDLHMPQILAALGAGRQLVIDIRPLLVNRLVTDIARRLWNWSPAPTGWKARLPEEHESIPEFLRRLGVFYRAPCDARATGLPDQSVDYITSTNTLEHIDEPSLAAILSECRRILRAGGIMSFQVDFQDHWSYFDQDIDVFNFLEYDERTWRRYNPDLHYQNRLRHPDYLRIYEEAGFSVVAEEQLGGDPDDVEAVLAHDLDPRFSSMDPASVAIRGSKVVLRAMQEPIRTP